MLHLKYLATKSISWSHGVCGRYFARLARGFGFATGAGGALATWPSDRSKLFSEIGAYLRAVSRKRAYWSGSSWCGRVFGFGIGHPLGREYTTAQAGAL